VSDSAIYVLKYVDFNFSKTSEFDVYCVVVSCCC